MKRLFLVAFAVAGALFGTAGAQAKGPPDGVDICGASGTCVHLSTQDAETNWPLWAPPSPYQTDRASYIDAFFNNLDWATVNDWVSKYQIKP